MTAQFAPVMPLSIAAKVRDHLGEQMLGGYHLLLAHDVAANPTEYGRVYGGLEDATIIMDNSLIELGKPVDMVTMMFALYAVPSEYMVLPDHLGNRLRTLEESRGYNRQWRAIQQDSAEPGRVKTCGVVQGKTVHELMDCALTYIHDMHVGMLSVPRVVTDTLGTRREIVEMINLARYAPPIHLLGFSENMEDDIICASMPNVAGIDSAVPIRCATQGLVCRDPRNIPNPGPRGKWWDDPLSQAPSDWLEILRINLLYVRDWIRHNPYR